MLSSKFFCRAKVHFTSRLVLPNPLSAVWSRWLVSSASSSTGLVLCHVWHVHWDDPSVLIVVPRASQLLCFQTNHHTSHCTESSLHLPHCPLLSVLWPLGFANGYRTKWWAPKSFLLFIGHSLKILRVNATKSRSSQCHVILLLPWHHAIFSPKLTKSKDEVLKGLTDS